MVSWICVAFRDIRCMYEMHTPSRMILPSMGHLGILFPPRSLPIRFLQYDHQTAVVLPIVQGSPNYQVSTQKLLFLSRVLDAQ